MNDETLNWEDMPIVSEEDLDEKADILVSYYNEETQAKQHGRVAFDEFYRGLEEVVTNIGWRDIAVGGQFVIAIKKDGTLWGWGRNDYGQIGNGKINDNVLTPIKISTDNDWEAISAGSSHSLALKSDGTLWAWGNNNYGQLGNGSSDTIVLTPTKIGTDTDWDMISAGGFQSFGIKTSGSLWGWGKNDRGEVGIGRQGLSQWTPAQLSGWDDWQKIDAGYRHSLAIKKDGTLWGWGITYAIGMTGDSNIPITYPTQIGNDADWADISAGDGRSFAIKKDGTLFSTGSSIYGENGYQNGTWLLEEFKEIQKGSLWSKAYASDSHSLAIKRDGTLCSWGQGNAFQKGDGYAGGHNNSSSAYQIGKDNDWVDTACEREVSFALKSDGSLWCFGASRYGQLGIPSTNAMYPTQIETVLQVGDGGTGRYDGYAQGIVRENVFIYSGSNTSEIRLPSGGTWFIYYLRTYNPSQGWNAVYSLMTGFVAGGYSFSIIANTKLSVMAIRVA